MHSAEWERTFRVARALKLERELLSRYAVYKFEISYLHKIKLLIKVYNKKSSPNHHFCRLLTITCNSVHK